MVPTIQSTAHQWVNARLHELDNTDTGFSMLVATRPYRYSTPILKRYRAQYSVIGDLFSGTLRAFQAALNGDVDPIVLRWLLNDTPVSWDLEYHRRLQPCHLTCPMFYRTDEVAPGRIAEVQCPGSLWGDHQLLWEYFSQNLTTSEELGPSLADQFARVLTEMLPDGVKIHYLLDNASVPQTARYFLYATRPACQYFGYDRRLRPEDCNLVRSHSFYGLVAQNEATRRLKQCEDGTVHYDLPPHVLFDQKVPLCLPFMSETQAYFPEAVRDAVLFSQLVRPEGFRLEDGQWVTLETFAARPRAQRRYMLKYAGTDVARNWGARAVYSLERVGREQCLRMLAEVASEVARGSAWMIQRAEVQREDVEVRSDEGRKVVRGATAKYSGFYGPAGFMGGLVMHRRFYKVHGQEDTIVSISSVEEGE